MQILADGAEMNPVAAGDFAFDGVGTADDFYEGHAMQRSIVLGPGKHTIQVLSVGHTLRHGLLPG